MTTTQKVTNKEFNDIDQALRRTAKTAKKLADQNGTPYVVYRDSNNEKFLDEKQTNANPNKLERHGYIVVDEKDSVAGKPVLNCTVMLLPAWQK